MQVIFFLPWMVLPAARSQMYVYLHGQQYIADKLVQVTGGINQQSATVIK
jgi:hypothetical protein